MMYSENVPFVENEPLPNVPRLLPVTATNFDYLSKNSGSTRSYNRWLPHEEGITVAWRELSVHARTKSSGNNFSERSYKRIVNNVTGAVKAGTLVALMGASGAGKTTLMNALANRASADMVIEGDIFINGRKIGDYMRYLSGFLYQHDIFIGSLTVYEHLMIMARLKFDRRATDRERQDQINYLIRQLGLTHCTHSRIGLTGSEKVLSGGEKKRLAFATELLTNPPLLFCDEPTSGLDSYSAQKIVEMMKMMTRQGKTVICTIHQPSSEIFAMFHQLILLADGRIAFIGDIDKALEFFSKQGYECPRNYNPAEFLIKTVAITPGFEEESKLSIKKICDQFIVSDEAKEIDFIVQYEVHMGLSFDQASYKSVKIRQDPFWWTKLWWVTYRSALQVIRDPSVQRLRIIQKMAIALMVGLCYFGSITLTQTGIQAVQGALFLLVTENTFSPMYSVLGIIPKEFPLFIREYKSGLYSTSIYYLANMIAVLPGLVIEPILFVAICYSLSGLRNTFYAMLMTSFVIVLTMNVSTACGTFFSAAFNSVPIAMAFLIPFDYVLMITSGLFVQLSTLPWYIQWTKYLSWMMYSNEAISIVQWEGISNITCDVQDPVYPCLRTGEQILQKYSFSASHLQLDIIYMIILYCTYHILGFAFLMRRARKN